MRLLGLATLIILGLCLAYAHHLEPDTPLSMFYNGPATVMSLREDSEQNVLGHWLLVCDVDGTRVAFRLHDDAARRTLAHVTPGQHVTLCYDLPGCVAGGYAELRPPTLRSITPAGTTDAVSYALNTDDQ